MFPRDSIVDLICSAYRSMALLPAPRDAIAQSAGDRAMATELVSRIDNAPANT